MKVDNKEDDLIHISANVNVFSVFFPTRPSHHVFHFALNARLNVLYPFSVVIERDSHGGGCTNRIEFEDQPYHESNCQNNSSKKDVPTPVRIIF